MLNMFCQWFLSSVFYFRDRHQILLLILPLNVPIPDKVKTLS